MPFRGVRYFVISCLLLLAAALAPLGVLHAQTSTQTLDAGTQSLLGARHGTAIWAFDIPPKPEQTEFTADDYKPTYRRDTIEAIAALQTIGIDQSEYVDTLDWLAEYHIPTSGRHGRRIALLANAGRQTNDLLDTLLLQQNADGGFGAGLGSPSDPLETAEALEALQDTIDLSDPATLDERLGELLYLSGALYQQNLNMADRENTALSGVVDVREVTEVMYFLTTKVDFFFGIPRGITPVGITADLDRNVHLVIPIDGDNSRIKAFMQLEGNQSSFLEHAATENVYQSEALSAVKGIQLANGQGIPVHTVTGQNIATLLPTLQVSQEIKTDITNAVNQGWEAIVPERNLVLQDWTGVGYILQNPANGEGFYRISGGFGGAVMVSANVIKDILVAQALFAFAEVVKEGLTRPAVCYPGQDNLDGTTDDTCYFLTAINELDTNELQACADAADPGCLKRYEFNHDFSKQPLIDTQQFAEKLERHLTKFIKARDWQSQDNARYMRAGRSVLKTIEELMDIFQVTQHLLRVGDTGGGSGYRTFTRNLFLTKEGASEKSHHPDGVAADITLISSGNEPTQSSVLCTAEVLILSRGEVLKEDNVRGVHISIPGVYNSDFTGCSGFLP